MVFWLPLRIKFYVLVLFPELSILGMGRPVWTLRPFKRPTDLSIWRKGVITTGSRLLGPGDSCFHTVPAGAGVSQEVLQG